MKVHFVISRWTLSVGFIVFSLAGLASKGQGVLTGTIQNLGSSPYVYIYEFLGSDLLKMDSVKHKEGRFSYPLRKDFPRGFYKIGASEEASVAMILSPAEKPVLSVDLKDIESSYSFSDSKENLAYKEFNTINQRQSDFFNNLNKEAQLAQSQYSSDADAYQKVINGLQKRLDSSNTERKKQVNALQAKYAGTFMEKFMKMFSFDADNKETFFSPTDFTDTELSRGDMLPSKIALYMQRFVAQDLDSWKEASEVILARATVANRNKEVLYGTIIRNMVNSDLKYAKKLAKQYIAEFPQSATAKYFWDALPKEPPVAGEEAPDITLETPEGKKLSLSSLRGKVVLLDFWASWCGPCRAENPNVARAYDAYKDKGFTVYSVSLDTDRNKWLKAIETDKLSWESHVSDLKGWQSAPARLYGVSGIPSTFLLDSTGKVVAVNLRGASLHNKLRELLGDKE